MSKLTDYLVKNTERGDCTCGGCMDAPDTPTQPDGSTADVVFFHVKAGPEANADTLRELVRGHKGEWNNVDLFDGNEHNYIELGGWIGDQGMALTLMGLGSLLGLWKLLTPRTQLGPDLSDELVNRMAGMGFVAVRAGNPESASPR